MLLLDFNILFTLNKFLLQEIPLLLNIVVYASQVMKFTNCMLVLSRENTIKFNVVSFKT